MSNPESFLSKLVEEYKCPALLDKRGYFDDWKKNVFGEAMPSCFYKMFAKGNGGELKGKARAIHSSSMLAYNFFHWVSEDAPLTLFGKTFVDVAFEVKLPCLNRGMANLDVALVGKDRKSVLFLESKFTEYFNNRTFSMSESYKNQNCYAGKAACSWSSAVESVETLVEERMKTEKNYYEGIKQCVCHLIAIDRLRDCLKRIKLAEALSLRPDFRFDFATIVFEPNGGDFEKEHGEFTKYRNLFDCFVETVNQKIHSNDNLFWHPDKELKHPGFLTYGDVWIDKDAKNSLSKQKQLRTYLHEKYMRLSATPEP